MKHPDFETFINFRQVSILTVCFLAIPGFNIIFMHGRFIIRKIESHYKLVQLHKAIIKNYPREFWNVGNKNYQKINKQIETTI